MTVHTRKAWTGAEKIRLAKLYPTSPWDEILRELEGHSRHSIYVMANELGIKRVCSRRSRIQILQQLRETRVEAGMSQTSLARLIGVDRGVLTRWETGRSLPRLPMLLDWAEAAGFRLRLERA